MQCGDLERYLEAFLDGRLGRSRSAILRRHLALCGSCRARIERLRQFERDMQRRFRSMNQDESIWRGLELDLVAAGRGTSGPLLALPRLLPAPATPPSGGSKAPTRQGRHPMLAVRAGPRGRTSRLAGVVLIAMALGAVYQFARDYLAPAEDGPAAVTRAYQELVGESHALALSSEDPDQLEAWLSTELGAPVDLPVTPAGYRPLGADRAGLDSGPAAAVVYAAIGDDPGVAAVLFVEAAAPADVAAAAATEPVPDRGPASLRELSWNRAQVRYTLLSERPLDELRAFVN